MEIRKIYYQYLADQQDGFVSNLDSYIEETYKDLAEHERAFIKQYIEKKIGICTKKEFICTKCKKSFLSNDEKAKKCPECSAK